MMRAWDALRPLCCTPHPGFDVWRARICQGRGHGCLSYLPKHAGKDICNGAAQRTYWTCLAVHVLTLYALRGFSDIVPHLCCHAKSMPKG